jgi:hypothetical protein
MQTVTNFAYTMDPTALGIDTSSEAELRWCLNRAATRAYRQSQREFAASLLRQYGRWSAKQKAWANAFWRSRRDEWRTWLAEECCDRSVAALIAKVGPEAATAYAFQLCEEAARIHAQVSDGKEYADTHDRHSDRYWRSREDTAERKIEMAKRIVRIATV